MRARNPPADCSKNPLHCPDPFHQCGVSLQGSAFPGLALSSNRSSLWNWNLNSKLEGQSSCCELQAAQLVGIHRCLRVAYQKLMPKFQEGVWRLVSTFIYTSPPDITIVLQVYRKTDKYPRFLTNMNGLINTLNWICIINNLTFAEILQVCWSIQVPSL